MSNNEHTIAQAEASIMVYDEPSKKWQSVLGQPVLSSICVTHHIATNTFRIVGRHSKSTDVIISCQIVKNLKYNQATTTFHQWRDNKTIYGLNFPSIENAESFASGIKNALEILSRDVPEHITKTVPPPSQPPALPPRRNSSHGGPNVLEPKYINVDEKLIDKYREKDYAMAENMYSTVGGSDAGHGYETSSAEHNRDIITPLSHNHSSGSLGHQRNGSYHKNGGQAFPNDDANDDSMSIYSTSTNSSSSSNGHQHADDQSLNPNSATSQGHHRGASTGSNHSNPGFPCPSQAPPQFNPQTPPNQFQPSHYSSPPSAHQSAAQPPPPPAPSVPQHHVPHQPPAPPNALPNIPPAAPSAPEPSPPDEEPAPNSLAAMLQGVKLKKSKPAEQAGVPPAPKGPKAPSAPGPPPAPSAAAPTAAAAPAAAPAPPVNNMMSEMSALLAKRKQMAEGGSSDGARSDGVGSIKAAVAAQQPPTPVGSLSRKKSLPESALAAQLSNIGAGAAGLRATGSSLASASSSAAGDGAVSQAALDAIKQEILSTLRSEIQSAKQEILDAIRSQKYR